MKPKTLILRSAGTNCDEETAYAFELAGASGERVHINRILENPTLIGDYQILALPGGFSYGDDIAAGRILANQIVNHLADALQGFVAAGKPIIGICNGFQVLVKTNLLPGPLAGRTGQTSTLAHNDSGRFVDRWVELTPKSSRCIWTADLPDRLELPIAHGEGKFIPADETVRKALWDNKQVALTYAADNPNGSVDNIAGVCDASGLVFGLMPHPERFVDAVQHPNWSRKRGRTDKGVGLQMIMNAVRHSG